MKLVMKRMRHMLALLLLFLAIPHHSPAAMSFGSPLSGAYGTNWFIINFKDNGDGVTPLDYAGGRQTYPTHTGIDIMLYDYLTMDEGIEVRAAAPGTVINFVDGLDDRVLESQPNSIFVRHADGSVSYYAHLKMNSILVATGQVVSAGEKMAEVGGDGTNEVSHLHFGVLDRWATNGIWCDIMTNQLGLSQSFDWFDNYTNQVIRHVYGMGVTITNDPAFSLPAWRQQQTPSSYSMIHSGPFAVWIKYTGRNTNDFLAIRLLNQSGPGETIDFSSCGWYPSGYLIYNLPLWYSSWISASLSNGTTYKLQYRWNGEEWRDGPGDNTVTVADDRQEIYLSRISLPTYSNAPAPPVSLDASDGAHTACVRLAWAPSASAVRYIVYRGTGTNAAGATEIARTSNSGYDDVSVLPNTMYTYWIAASNAKGTGALSSADSGYALEGPYIRANESDEAIISSDDRLSVTVELNPGQYQGVEVDWWVVARAGSSWYCMDSAAGWTQEFAWRPRYQGPLFNLPPTEVLNMTGLPAGSYTFYFAVDYPMDGTINLDKIMVDSVDVIVH